MLDASKIDVEKISALVENGMLAVKIPKKNIDKIENKRIIDIEWRFCGCWDNHDKNSAQENRDAANLIS